MAGSGRRNNKSNNSPRGNLATIPGGTDPISVLPPVDTGHFTYDEAGSGSDSNKLQSPQGNTAEDEEMQKEYELRTRYGPVVHLVAPGDTTMDYLSDPSYVEEVKLELPGCYPLMNYPRDSWEVTRINECIALGIKATRGEQLSSVRIHPTRNDLLKRFANEYELVSNLLTIVERYNAPSNSPVGYRVKYEQWVTVSTALRERRNRVKNSMQQQGIPIPGLPLWGKGQDIASFYNPNDFEIYAATFRYDVETFIAIICQEEKRSEGQIISGSVAQAPGERSQQHDLDDDIDVYDSVSRVQRRKRTGRKDQQLRFEKEDTGGNLTPRHTEPRQNEPSEDRYGSHSRIPGSPLGALLPENRISATLRPSAATHAAGRGLMALFPGRDIPPHQANEFRNLQKPGSTHRQQGREPDDEPSDSDDDYAAGKGRRKNTPIPPRKGSNTNNSSSTPVTVTFDQKLKVEIIPTWDGNPDTLGRWISKVNRLSERSDLVYEQLGVLVPTRLKDSAETWYYSLSPVTRARIEKNWGTLRESIGAYFMNRSYLDKQKARANRMSYRDSSAPRETPSEYFIRKLELLELVYNYSDTELINEIMAGAPSQWTAVLTPHLYHSIEDFQRVFKFHEESLIQLGSASISRPIYTRYNQGTTQSRNPFNANNPPTQVRTNLVGWSKQATNPPFPKDDANISPRGTPVSKGGRPCRHCGSGNHWDPECKYARKGEKRARVNLASISVEDREAQSVYDELYYSLVSDEEEEQDFYKDIEPHPDT